MSAPGTRSRRSPAHRSARLVGFGVIGALVTLGGLTVSPVQAATVTVSGWVYRDLDNDGVRDAGEPGVAGIRVHRNSGNGTPTTTTDANGHWTLSGLTPGASGVLQVETGWFRSQCAALSCAPGPGPDNDFKTANQFIQYPFASLSGARSDLNVGLVPDWPGNSSAAPAPKSGVVAANTVDVASRLSWVTSRCTDGSAFICRPGDTYTVTAQIHNEGTTSLTGIKARLSLPGADRFAGTSPTGSVSLVGVATSPGITAMSVSGFDQATKSVQLTFTGTLVPGGLIRVNANVVVGAGKGTRGCNRGAPTSTCPTGEPMGAPLVLAVTHIDQTGDPDSFGPGCAGLADIRLCPEGIHDKQVEPDEVDPVGHNMDAGLGLDNTFDLTATAAVLTTPPAGGWRPGASLVVRASAYNTGPGTAMKGWTLVVLFPKGTTVTVPTSHALRKCAKTTLGTGVIKVTCTGKGPLSPEITSIAIDIPAKVPSSAARPSTWQVLAYVAPVAGDPAETNKLGTAPTTPSVNASSTATDNDANAKVAIS